MTQELAARDQTRSPRHGRSLRCALRLPSSESENGSIVNFGKNIVPSAENVLKPGRGRGKDETEAMPRLERAGLGKNGQLAKNKGNEQQNAEKVVRRRKILDKGKERVISERPE